MPELDKFEILGGLLRRVGNFNPDSFEKSFKDRLIFQKTIYLLQSFNIYLGFHFSWYIRGPYSPVLAKEGYKLIKKSDQTPNVKFLEESSERQFQKFITFLGERNNDAEWLETLASIHFLKHTYLGIGKNSIMKMVQRKQPHLTIEKCQAAWDYLESFGLIPGG